MHLHIGALQVLQYVVEWMVRSGEGFEQTAVQTAGPISHTKSLPRELGTVVPSRAQSASPTSAAAARQQQVKREKDPLIGELILIHDGARPMLRRLSHGIAAGKWVGHQAVVRDSSHGFYNVNVVEVPTAEASHSAQIAT